MEKIPLYIQALLEIEPPPKLCSTIICKIRATNVRTARIYCASLTAVCFISGMLLVALAQNIGRELYASGFYDFASLLFSSDVGVISHLGRELTYSLMESLPALAMLCSFLICSMLFWALRKIFLLRKAAQLPYSYLLWS